MRFYKTLPIWRGNEEKHRDRIAAMLCNCMQNALMKAPARWIWPLVCGWLLYTVCMISWPVLQNPLRYAGLC